MLLWISALPQDSIIVVDHEKIGTHDVHIGMILKKANLGLEFLPLTDIVAIKSAEEAAVGLLQPEIVLPRQTRSVLIDMMSYTLVGELREDIRRGQVRRVFNDDDLEVVKGLIEQTPDRQSEEAPVRPENGDNDGDERISPSTGP